MLTAGNMLPPVGSLTCVDGQVTFAISPLIRGISLARKILLADDSVTAQNMGRKILADAGYEIIAVNNGSAALKKIAELKPDLVILDVYMPGYSGLEVCQRLKDSPETSRIPVLLTVGKLEPFKPDEAQRVRAEGYIVKPFEASELLSALSKLEDKVVPRSEPSKPGRFARATAAAEESGSGSRSESSTGDNGWKSRISFPHKKTEPEEKVADESSTYNPVNRDLRTVVETAEEKAEYKNQHAAPEAETRADAEATASAGAPRDVTPEEIAAMTAAAAQMQMASAATNEEQRASETASQAGPEPATAALNAEVRTAAAEDSKGGKVEESVAAFAAVAMDDRHNGGKKPEETEQAQDGPMTMAAAVDSVSTESVGGSRWTAVSVALETEETRYRSIGKCRRPMRPLSRTLPSQLRQRQIPFSLRRPLPLRNRLWNRRRQFQILNPKLPRNRSLRLSSRHRKLKRAQSCSWSMPRTILFSLLRKQLARKNRRTHHRRSRFQMLLPRWRRMEGMVRPSKRLLSHLRRPSSPRRVKRR